MYAAIKRYWCPPDADKPITVYYDNACNLSQYMLNRDPKVALATTLFHDR